MNPIVQPALYCPFPAALNRHASLAQSGTITWARRYNLFQREASYRRLSRLAYSMLMARAYPNAAPEKLQIAADWCTWLFLLDDECDEAGIGKNPEQLAAMHVRLLDILRGTPPAQHDEPLSHGLWDLYKRFQKYMDAEWLQRFRDSVRMYFEANVWEATNRQLGRTPDAATYRAMRPLTSAVYPCFMLIELTDDLRLPKAVYTHSDVRSLELMANNVISWSNDLISLEKELRQGDVHNLAIVTAHEQQIPLQDAVDQVGALHDAEARAFVALSARLPSFEPGVDADLARYVMGMRYWMRANYDWSLDAARYQSTLAQPALVAV